MKNKIHILLIIISVLLVQEVELCAQRRKPPRPRFMEIRKRIEFARDFQASVQDSEAEKLLINAELSLRRAVRQDRAGRPVQAQRLIKQSSQSVNQAIKIIFKEPLKLRKEKLRQLIDEAEKIVTPSENVEAQTIFQKGLNSSKLAAIAYRNNNFQNVINFYNRATHLIQKSIDLVKNSDKSVGQAASDESYRFDQFFLKNKEIINSSKNETVQRNRRLALNLARKAEAANNSGEYRQAIDYYHQATRLLLRALNIAEGKTDQSASRVYAEIALLDELIENIEIEILPEQKNEQLNFLLQQVKQLQEEAHTALDNQDFDKTLLKTRAARNKIDKVIKKSKSKKLPPGQKTSRDLERLSLRIEEITKHVTGTTDSEAKILLNYANVAKRKAGQAIQNKNHRIANEVIRMASKFANSAEQLAMYGPLKKLTPEAISDRLRRLESSLQETQFDGFNPKQAEINFCLEQTQKMLELAQDNYDKGFLHVSNACLKLGTGYLNKCRLIIK